MRLFVSYARGDHAAVRKLARLLDSMGVEYFMDQKDIHWGDRITTRVTHGLTSADATIVVVSPASVKSQWVAFEIGYSMASGKKILPYLTHPAMDLPGFLSDILHVSSLEDVRRFVEYSMTTSALSESDIPTADNGAEGASGRDNDELLCPYDWYNEVGYRDSTQLKKGVRVLYEETALFPELDEKYYRRLRRIRIPERPYQVSPRGFVKISKADWEWHDPRNRGRRIYDAVIHAVLSPTEVAFHEGHRVGIQIIVDVLEAAQ